MTKAERAKRAEEILRLNKVGYTPYEIAEEMGIKNYHVYRTLKGIDKNKKPMTRLSEESMKFLMENFGTMPLREIGKHLNMSSTGVKKVYERFKKEEEND